MMYFFYINKIKITYFSLSDISFHITSLILSTNF